MSQRVSRLRLVYVVPGKTFAGVEHVVHEVASWLAANKPELDVHVLYFAHFKERAGVKTAYTMHVLEGLRMRNAFFPLRRFFKSLKPDILIVAQCEMSTLCYVATGFNNDNAIFVPHLHGNPKIEQGGSWRSRLFFAAFKRFIAPGVSAMFTVSEALGDYARAELAAGRPVYYVPNPVRPLPGAIDHTPVAGPPRFVNVARLSRQKGQDTLLRAFAIVLRAIPEAQLTLVGGGEDEYALKALASDLAIEDAVQFAGHRPDPTPYLKAATCFVFPSRWEGFGLALTEALSLGLPVIVSDCDFGPREIISDARVGVIVKVDDVDGLAQGMLDMARRQMDHEAVAMRRAIVSRYETPLAARAHFEVIDQLVSKRKQQALASG